MFDLSKLIAPPRTARAHCDIPCGIYDPEQARIEAESCYRIIEKYEASSDELFRQRCVVVKEERAELTKHHIDVLWHDYFKPEHVEKYPDLHEVCWKASIAPRPGELVLAEDEDRLLVKRVGGISPEGTVALLGDAPSVGTHRHDATVPLAAISGRPWFRFWPPGRIGRVR